jgi:hypothetical protein
MFSTPRSNRSRTDLPDDNTPARGLYRETNDRAIYELARSFFAAAEETLWRHAGERSYIIRTVGLQALFDILGEVAEAAIASKNLKQSVFAEKLRKAGHIDFSIDFYQASGKGRVRIKHSLALAMGLEAPGDLPESDRDQYISIVQGTPRKQST